MGTRSLTIVKKNNKTVIAKYAQFDGYPSGLGNSLISAIKFIGIERIKKIVDCVRVADQEDIDYINSFNKIVPNKGKYGDDEVEWKLKFPWVSRECDGADLLYFLDDTCDTGNTLALIFKEDFAADSLFCEWCYVIDLDKGSFEVFRGFNKTPLTEEDRFYYLSDKIKNDYYPVKILTSYSLNDLPDDISFLEEKD
jgi:hypothetical protein